MAETPADKPQKQDKQEKGAEKKPERAAPKKEEQFGPDFRYLVRLVNTDLDGKRAVSVALTYVPGVSHRLAAVVARVAGVDPKERIGNLKDDEIAAVNEAIEALEDNIPVWMQNRRKDPESGEDRHMVGSEIQIMLREDLNRLKKIRSWRGARHERKLPTRGQRTKNNGRFGSAVGVQRKVEGQPATGAPGAPAAGGAPAAPA
ncbi:MAG: 30S ribosomal protein S13, partial [Halobacteriales archaeon]|nr:30S ribosomal protein S13 [Halobacteriales archaeon]